MNFLNYNHMRPIYLLLFLFASLAVSAQEDLKPLVSLSEFQERLLEETSKIISIESDFTQEKYVDVFSEKMISKGRFYYKQDHMIRMDYTHPLTYELVINGDKLKMVSEGQSNIINLGSNQMMKETKRMISACMTGNLANIPSIYRLSYFETSTLYVVKIVPATRQIKDYIKEIKVSLDKKDMSVQTLRLSETEKDYTEYHFTNKKYNTLSGNEIFAIP